MTAKKTMTKLYDPKRNRPTQNPDDTRYSVDVLTIDETGMYGIAYFHFAKEEWVFLTDTLVDYDEPGSETEWKWYYPEVKWGESTEDPDPSELLKEAVEHLQTVLPYIREEDREDTVICEAREFLTKYSVRV